MRLPLTALFLALLTACGGPPPERFAVPNIAAGERVRIAYGSVEVREVTLPAYAELEEIAVEGPDGAITTSEALLWADNPSRAVSLSLTRTLAEITGAKVAPEPWPFRDFAAVRVDVRIEEMLAGNDGAFRLSGQYFAAPDGPGRDRAASFAFRVPITGEGPAAIAAARGQAVSALALAIARDGLR